MAEHEPMRTFQEKDIKIMSVKIVPENPAKNLTRIAGTKMFLPPKTQWQMDWMRIGGLLNA